MCLCWFSFVVCVVGVVLFSVWRSYYCVSFLGSYSVCFSWWFLGVFGVVVVSC